jgi:hypothetical protein
MRHSEDIGKIAEALAKAQPEFVMPSKNQKVKYGQTEFWYADLTACLEAVTGPLNKNGIAIIQPFDIEDDNLFIYTRLIHSSGQWLESCYPAKIVGKHQDMGAAITYGRRYSLCGITGLSADDDKDGADAAKVDGVRKKAPSGPPTVKETKEPANGLSPIANKFVSQFNSELGDTRSKDQIEELKTVWAKELEMMKKYPDAHTELMVEIGRHAATVV